MHGGTEGTGLNHAAVWGRAGGSSPRWEQGGARAQALSHADLSLPSQAQRNAAPSGTCCQPLLLLCTLVPGLLSKSGWGSEEEELLPPGAHTASAGGLGSMAEAAAHCLLKGSREGGHSFTEEGHEDRA